MQDLRSRTERCETCDHFVTQLDAEREGHGPRAYQPACRAEPPKAMMIPVQQPGRVQIDNRAGAAQLGFQCLSYWPPVQPLQWCGSYTPRQPFRDVDERQGP